MADSFRWTWWTWLAKGESIKVQVLRLLLAFFLGEAGDEGFWLQVRLLASGPWLKAPGYRQRLKCKR